MQHLEVKQVENMNPISLMRVTHHDIRMALEFVTGPVKDDKEFFGKLKTAKGFIAQLRDLYIKVLKENFNEKNQLELINILKGYQEKELCAESLCYRSLFYLVYQRRPLANAPWEVDADDLTDDGKLRVTEIPKILAMIDESKEKSGRIRKHSYVKPAEDKNPQEIIIGSGSNCGARFRKDGQGRVKKISCIPKGKKHGKLIAEGGFGRVKVMMDHQTKAWEVLKLIAKKDKKEFNKQEYKIAHLMDLASDETVRYSPDKKQEQKEIEMKWIPGDSFEGIRLGDPDKEKSPRKIHIAFLLDLFWKMLEAVQLFHQKTGFFHRDLKALNFMVNGTDVTLIDCGDAKKQSECAACCGATDFAGTFGHHHPKIIANFKEKNICQFDLSTEIYALGSMMAEYLDFLSLEAKRDAAKDPKKFSVYDLMKKGGYTLINPADSAFETNTWIPDETLRTDVLTLIRRMMSLDEKMQINEKVQPKDLTECMNEVAKLRLRANAVPIKTAIINLSEFITCSEEVQKRMLSMAKKHSSYVQFIETEESMHTAKQEILARRMFEKEMLVATQVIPVGKDLKKLPDILKFNSDQTKKFDYTYVTSKALNINSKEAAAISQKLSAAGIKVQRTAELNRFAQFQLPSAAAGQSFQLPTAATFQLPTAAARGPSSSPRMRGSSSS